MKKLIQYSKISCLSALLCLFIIAPSYAQRGGGGGGHSSGGGGGHSGGGGGSHFSGGGGGRSFSGGGGAHSYGGGRSVSGIGGSQRSVSSVSGARRNYSQGQRSVSGIGVRGGVGLGNRGGVGYAGSRGYVRGYGHTGYNGIGRIGGGYFYSRGYYGSLYYPRLGFSCGFLPYGYYPFYWDNYPYYLSDGYYYTYNNDQYTIVEPPIGASITTLPSNAQSIVINGQQYYEKNGVYYQAVTQNDGSISYQIAGKDGQLNTNTNGTTTVAAPKVGDITTTLPADSRKININGKVYFVSPDGIYYQETIDSNNNTVYKIVGLENDGVNN